MSRKRMVLAGVGLGVAAYGVRALVERRRLVAAIVPDLRIPLLWAPLQVTSTRPFIRLMGRLPVPEPPLPHDVDVDHVQIQSVGGGPEVPAWVYRPRGATTTPTGGLVWIHGGGYVLGSAALDHEVCARFVRECHAVVVSPDYRLAHDAPFPAALDDCWAALDLLRNDPAVDPDRLAVAGESAGGGLAATLAQRAYDAGVTLRLQLLVYPMLDDRTAAERRPPTLVWTNPSDRRGWSAYLDHPVGQPEPRPYAVPARREDLSGLAPAWIGVGTEDLFLDEDLAYARRLDAAGVTCTTEVVPGMYHGAYGQAPADSPTAIAFRDRAAAAVREALRG